MLDDLVVKASRAAWVQSNFITDDTEAMSADANERLIEAPTKLAEDVKRFDGLKMPPVLERKFKLLKLSLFSLPDAKDRAEVTKSGNVAGSLIMAKASIALRRERTRASAWTLESWRRSFASSRDPEEMKDIWVGWHRVGAPMKQRYARFIELQNKGARELGFKDMGAMWRSNYDMTAGRIFGGGRATMEPGPGPCTSRCTLMCVRNW